MPRLGLWEILVIAIVLLVFFGANRIPEMMRGLAKGLRGFKDELTAEDAGKTPSGERRDTAQGNVSNESSNVSSNESSNEASTESSKSSNEASSKASNGA